ncbi:hypothetical protein B0H10DRAFT_888772 [Mycena sp. CBHHK59/15]|nr:hypothetical protein B0H10DRAFT_888772 [Mycena sp. CBHHK59/15]
MLLLEQPSRPSLTQAHPRRSRTILALSPKSALPAPTPPLSVPPARRRPPCDEPAIPPSPSLPSRMHHGHCPGAASREAQRGPRVGVRPAECRASLANGQRTPRSRAQLPRSAHSPPNPPHCAQSTHGPREEFAHRPSPGAHTARSRRVRARTCAVMLVVWVVSEQRGRPDGRAARDQLVRAVRAFDSSPVERKGSQRSAQPSAGASASSPSTAMPPDARLSPGSCRPSGAHGRVGRAGARASARTAPVVGALESTAECAEPSKPRAGPTTSGTALCTTSEGAVGDGFVRAEARGVATERSASRSIRVRGSGRAYASRRPRCAACRRRRASRRASVATGIHLSLKK